MNEFVDRGFNVRLSKESVDILDDKDNCVLTGPRDPVSRLWYIPLTSDPLLSTAAKAYQYGINFKNHADIVSYVHMTMGSPTYAIFSNAVKNGFITFPHLTIKMVQDNKPMSIHESAGHMKQKPKNYKAQVSAADTIDITRSTAPNIDHDIELEHIQASMDITGRISTDKQYTYPYIYIMYNELADYTWGTPIPNRQGKTIYDAFVKGNTIFKENGFPMTHARMDNEVTDILLNYMKKNGITTELTPPNQHRGNRAEREIGSFKSHIISAVSAMDDEYPVSRWHHCYQQMEFTYNMLRPCKHNRMISSYHNMYKKAYNFTKHPMAPLGTKVLAFETPAQRESFAAHGKPGFYVGPLHMHHKCYQVYIPETDALRTCETLTWLPRKFNPPKCTTTDILVAALQDLTNAVKTNPDNLKESLNKSSLQDILNMISITPQNTTNVIPIDTIKQLVSRNNKVQEEISIKTHHDIEENQVLIENITETDQVRSQDPADIINTKTINDLVITTETHQPELTVETSQQNNDIEIPQRAIKKVQIQRVSPTPPQQQIKHIHKHNLRSTNIAIVPAKPGNIQTKEPENETIYTFTTPDQASGISRKEAMDSKDRSNYIEANEVEFSKQFESGCLKPIREFPPNVKEVTYVSERYRTKSTNDGTSYHCRITLGGDKLKPTGPSRAETTQLDETKIFIQSVVSEGMNISSADIGAFFLNTPLTNTKDYKYCSMLFQNLSQKTIEKYNLQQFEVNGRIRFEVCQTMYGMKEAARLSYELLKSRLKKYEFNSTERNPCLFRHKNRSIGFILTVDDFLIKWKKKEDLDYLINSLENHYTMKVDINGRHYIGLTIAHDKITNTITISLPGYIDNIMKKFNVQSVKQCDNPVSSMEQMHNTTQQYDHHDKSLPATLEEKQFIQQVVGAVLYYSRAVGYSVITAICKVAREQSAPTKETVKKVKRILQYLYWHRNEAIKFTPQEMILQCHSDASYLSEPISKSRIAGIFWIGEDIILNPKYKIDGVISVDTHVVKNICTSIAEAEYTACFNNCITALRYQSFLEDLGYPQITPIKIYVDNDCSKGVANRTSKEKRLKHMNMRLHKVRELVDDKIVDVLWCSSKDNIADFGTKNFSKEIFKHQSERLNLNLKG